ncbi:MAG: helix-turn-helix domain-containing protein [Actinomycetota bacterium]|nr:helix-turn-helix domain-containing protein [Actinomycetota bacterium]
MYSGDVAPPHEDPSALAFLQLLAEPVRWQLLQELARSDRRVNELTALSGRPQNLVSYHLRELRTAGLVSGRRSAADGRDSYYTVDLDRCSRLLGAAGGALQPGLRQDRVATDLQALRGGRKQRVLFLCTGNSARSQIAEALLEVQSGHTVEARSAGSHPKDLHPDAVRVLAERGIDISGRRTKHLEQFADTRFDLVVTLCDKVREICPEFPGGPATAHWSIPDPSLGGDADATYPAFETTVEELVTRIGFLLARLAEPTTDEESAHAR